MKSWRIKLYLDVCCLNRPFDDQEQERVRLEAEAVKEILLRIGRKEWTWVGSDVVMYEISRIADPDRCLDVGLLTADFAETIQAGERDSSRADELEKLGFKNPDALHLACAERAEVAVFLTTDDGLLRTAGRHAGAMRVKVMNPRDWLAEVY